ncbi:MAG: U32 family peptidase [Magnetococcales bacterium]|nr:U32 family peptidase [Magnetococcales bacterium]
MKIAIGPCLFEWGKKAIQQFYQRMAFETDADILYIGEVVCSKRHHLTAAELGELAELLRPSGKEVVFSTLGLVMSAEEQDSLRQVAEQATKQGVWLEVNDMGGMGVGEGLPLVAGPHINTYNAETVAFLRRIGVKRVVLPVELAHATMTDIFSVDGSAGLQKEVFAFGRLPLTFSARCYTARAFQLSKSNCQYKCGLFPDGMEMRTQEQVPFLHINGTQTLSAQVFNLILDVPRLRQMGVDVLRLSPQSQNMAESVAVWKQCLANRISGSDALAHLREWNAGKPFCNGYFHGQPGLEFVGPEA